MFDLKFKDKIAILVCKFVRAVGKAVGKGSSLPGAVALKFDGDVLKRISLPKKIIAVTGSNGKTSTVEMIVASLKANGLTVAYNSEGANQLDGVATFILCNSNMKGVVDKDVLVVEADEQSARHIFKYFTPTLYVINNLYRDQLSRNGHPERIFGIIKESIAEGVRLVLNADDPLTASFGFGREGTVYFGVAGNENLSAECDSAYDDGAFCPVCNARLEYGYRLYNHIGSYLCKKCGFKRDNVKYEVTDIKENEIVLNGNRIGFKLLGLHNVHNMLAAYSVLAELGYATDATVDALSAHILKSGRTVSFKIGENYGTLLVSKHENSIAYDRSIDVVANYKKPATVVIIVDAVSRKYFTSDTSWLYDIDFEKLDLPFINNIILAGKYCYDLAERFSYTSVNKDILVVSERVDDAMENLKYSDMGRIFILTCFSDKHKALAHCEVLPYDFEIPESEAACDED